MINRRSLRVKVLQLLFSYYNQLVNKEEKKKLKIKVLYNGPIEAPIKKDQIIAKLNISYDQNLIGEYELLAKNEVKKVNIFSRLLKSLNYLIWGDV